MSKWPGPSLGQLPWPRRRLLIAAASTALAVVLLPVARGAVRAIELNAGSRCFLAHRADPLHAGALAGAIRWYASADHAVPVASRARAGHVRALVAAGQAEEGAALLDSSSATVDPFAGLEVGAALWDGGSAQAM